MRLVPLVPPALKEYKVLLASQDLLVRPAPQDPKVSRESKEALASRV